jgi:rhamnosyltransferase
VSISSIVITYQPDIYILSKLILENASFFKKIIIVDNGSENITEIRKVVINSNKIMLIELENNFGIATAQNIGIRNLDVDNDDVIIFFDQDSSLDESFLNNIERELCTLEERIDSPIILGPCFFHRSQQFEYPSILFNKYGIREKLYPSSFKESFEVSCIISSGMCVRKKTLDYIGDMKDELFIDYVDTEWCLRAKSMGCHIFVSPKIRMDHEIGTDNIKIFKWRVPIHSAKRRYYRIRNSVMMLKYSYFPIIAVMREVVFNIFHQLLLIIICKQKVELIKSLLNGAKDGLCGLLKKSKEI